MRISGAGGCQDECGCQGEETRRVAGGMLVVIVTIMPMIMVSDGIRDSADCDDDGYGDSHGGDGDSRPGVGYNFAYEISN